MISIDNVSFGYGEAQETLSQVSAAIAPGECVLLCGASGCGKTTVTKLINGLIPSFTPGCRLEGRVAVSYTHLDVYKRQVGTPGTSSASAVWGTIWGPCTADRIF